MFSGSDVVYVHLDAIVRSCTTAFAYSTSVTKDLVADGRPFIATEKLVGIWIDIPLNSFRGWRSLTGLGMSCVIAKHTPNPETTAEAHSHDPISVRSYEQPRDEKSKACDAFKGVPARVFFHPDTQRVWSGQG